MKILILLIGLCVVSIAHSCRHKYDVECDPYGRRCRRVKRPRNPRRTIYYPPITRLIQIPVTRPTQIPTTRPTDNPTTRPTETQVTRFTYNPTTRPTDKPISTPNTDSNKCPGLPESDCDYVIECDIENWELRYCCEAIYTVVGKVYSSRIFLDTCKSQLKDSSEEFLKTHRDLLQTQFEEESAIFDTFIEFAKIAGDDISECVDTYMSVWKTQAETMGFIMELSMEDGMKTADNLLDEKTTLIERIKDKLDNMLSDLSDCDGMKGASKSYCETSFRDKIAFLTKEVTAQLEKINNEAYDMVYLNLESHLLQSPVVAQMSRLAATGEMLIERAKSCIKINYSETAKILFREIPNGARNSSGVVMSLIIIIIIIVAHSLLLLKQE